MSFFLRLLAITLLGALFVSPAAARHRGQGTYRHASHQHTLPKLATPQIVPDRNAGDSAKGETHQDEIHRTDKGKLSGDDERGRPGRLGKAGTAVQEHPATGKDNATQGAVDTRITVYQGHNASKKFGKRPFKDNKDTGSNVAAGAGAKHAHPEDHHRAVARPASDQTHRNAIGVNVDLAKPAERRNATGLAVPLTPNSASELKVGLPPLASGALSHDVKTERLPDKVQVNHANGPIAAATVSTASAAAIEGTSLIRPSLRTGAIIGTPKIAGVISGNNIHLRHP